MSQRSWRSAFETVRHLVLDSPAAVPSCKTREWLDCRVSSHMVIDVRSPGEFRKGHAIGAKNLPLLDDSERAEVGTAFKRAGRFVAIQLGLDIVENKAEKLLETCRPFLLQDTRDAARQNESLAVYCARGGLRSHCMATFLQQGLNLGDVTVLQGGYKVYRNQVLETLGNPQWKLAVIGGRTGVGKTKILNELRTLGAQVLDLEQVAAHRGSAFGRIGWKHQEQPTSEFFANLVAHELSSFDPSLPVFVEDEGSHLGCVQVPSCLYTRIRSANPIFRVNVPLQARLENLCEDYAIETHISDLQSAVERIKKRLGSDRERACLEALEHRQFSSVAACLLEYYDKTYDRHLAKNRNSRAILDLDFDHRDYRQIAQVLLEKAYVHQPYRAMM